MKQNQVLLYKDSKKINHEFLDLILENCDIDNSTGQFYCKRCKNLMHIDWQKKRAFCENHIRGPSGLIYIEELLNIYL